MSDGFDYNYLFAADADFDQPLAASYLHHNLLLSQPFFPTVADHYNDPAHPPLEEAVTPRLLCNEMPCKTEDASVTSGWSSEPLPSEAALPPSSSPPPSPPPQAPIPSIIVAPWDMCLFASGVNTKRLCLHRYRGKYDLMRHWLSHFVGMDGLATRLNNNGELSPDAAVYIFGELWRFVRHTYMRAVLGALSPHATSMIGALCERMRVACTETYESPTYYAYLLHEAGNPFGLNVLLSSLMCGLAENHTCLICSRFVLPGQYSAAWEPPCQCYDPPQDIVVKTEPGALQF